MKKKFIVEMLALSLLFSIIGCGKKNVPADTSVAVPAAAEPVAAAKPADTVQEQYDHIIELYGYEVGLKDIEGYKPYVIVFKGDTGPFCKGNAYFKEGGKNLSLDDAKTQGIIRDYEIYFDTDRWDESLLVMYVSDNKTGLSLMPAPSDLKISFDGSIDVYDLLWADAAYKKIGIGNEYMMIDLSPDKDFAEDAFVCVKFVQYEHFRYGALGSDVGKDYLFINSVNYDNSYAVVK